MATQSEDVAALPETRLLAGIVVGSLLLGAYAAWITVAFLPRALTFLFVALGVGGTLYRRDDGHVAYAGYVFAGLLLLTPVMMILPDLLSAGAYGRGALELVFMAMNIVYFVVFAVIAGVVAYLSYRLGRSPT